MRIDVHAHYWTEDYLDLLVDLGQADAGAARGIGAGGGAELDARLQLMDRAGVQMQVLSACPQLPYGEDGKKAARAARFVNDQYWDLCQPGMLPAARRTFLDASAVTFGDGFPAA